MNIELTLAGVAIFAALTASPRHRVTASPRHRVTALTILAALEALDGYTIHTLN